jgi:hypothetical protein
MPWVDQMVPGRSAEARTSDPSELHKTLVLRVPAEEASVKVRCHGAVDEPEDMDRPVWAGVVPVQAAAGRPVQDRVWKQSPPCEGISPPSPTRLQR